MPLLTITLDGPPRGKGRPRFRRTFPKGGKLRPKAAKVRTYTDDKTADYERSLGFLARAAMRGRPPLDGPLSVTVEALMPIPGSWSAKKRASAEAGEIYPEGPPDWDNLGKIACDALNQIVYTDDRQIVQGSVTKRYSKTPSLKIEVRRWLAEGSKSVI